MTDQDDMDLSEERALHVLEQLRPGQGPEVVQRAGSGDAHHGIDGTDTVRQLLIRPREDVAVGLPS